MAINPARLSKNQRRRLKQKLAKQSSQTKSEEDPAADTNPQSSPKDTIDVEYVSLDLKQELNALSNDDPSYTEFMRVFSKFSSAEELMGTLDNEENYDDEKSTVARESLKNGVLDADAEEGQTPASRKQRKKMKRLSVAELKQLVAFPDVVEAHDVTAADPRFLVYLKSYRNTIPVPRHWCHKRKYLQGKRGIEKKPFMLPGHNFIAHTGIADVRGVDIEEDAKKTSKQKSRERMQPKVGRIDIDYQVLHDAFFRYQTKPDLSILGDLYFEGKEFEVKLKSKIPGQLSSELKNALGMVEGVPPPWLLNMQRYGPPPAYPNLKIPGLNAPIPEGASFGYHPGGWGKPPVDETGAPLYGDVFGKAVETRTLVEGIGRERWGELQEPEVIEEEQDEQSEDETTEQNDEVITTEHMDATGTETPLTDGISSVTSGLTTPGVVDLRKGIRGTETPDQPQQLYTVLPQQQASVGTALYGSAHAYVVPSANANVEGTASTISESGIRSASGRVRRRFEDVDPTPKIKSEDDDQESAKKSKKSKSEKSKKHKDFKF
ncbi:unnamed protein product [Albugo candida]|uniref:PSP proline-rich domain-containing protein n=1 Tax=Albugo candida TaxID=65357 RepID=A0A024GUA5_9STRA|nr:unnamed protein product [Albugo candida]|eukprot:CCI50321.1 unnamed protein product [Albugo candida]